MLHNLKLISNISLYINKIIQTILSFIGSIYIIRYLSVEDYGAYKLIFSILIFVTYITSFGLENTLLRFIPEYLNKKYYKNINIIILLFLFIRIISIIILFVFIILFKDKIILFFNIPDILIKYAPFIILLIFFNRIQSIIGLPLLASYSQIYLSQINVFIITILKFISIFIIIYYDLGLKGFIIFLLIFEIVSFIYYLILFLNKLKLNYIKSKYDTYFKNIEIYRISRFAYLSLLAVASGVFREIMIDNFVISHFLNVSYVGIYSFAAMNVGLIRQINPIDLLRPVLVPNIIKYYYNEVKKDEFLKDIFVLLNKIYFFVTLPLFIGMGFLIKEIIIIIYDPKYIVSIEPIIILIFGFSIGSLVYSFTPIINILEKNQLFFYSSIFSILNLALDIILVKKYGLKGIAFATSLVSVLLYIYYYLTVKKITGLNLKIPYIEFYKTLLNILPFLIFILIFRKYINNIILLIIIIIISIILYFVCSLYNNIFDDKDKILINKIFGLKIK